jgi:hypothetical protein
VGLGARSESVQNLAPGGKPARALPIRDALPILAPAASPGDFQIRTPKRRPSKAPSVSPAGLRCVLPRTPVGHPSCGFCGCEPPLGPGADSARRVLPAWLQALVALQFPITNYYRQGSSRALEKALVWAEVLRSAPGSWANPATSQGRICLSQNFSNLELKASLVRLRRPPGKKPAAWGGRSRPAVSAGLGRCRPTLELPPCIPPSRLCR